MAIRYNAGEVITAVVTPFDSEGKIDYEGYEKLINHLIDNGSDALLFAATTGESPTLGHKEEWQILKFAKKIIKNRAKIIMGAGSNSTDTAVKTAVKAEELGADAVLSVVPYYNKPSQDGIYSHFSEVAKAVNLPVILYNIPGRTGINMVPQTVAKLANDHKNIIGIKQSNSDLDLISDMKKLCPNDFLIYSGDDSLTLPMLSLGAYGVVSVASHIVGTEIKQMIKLFKSGENAAALGKHLKLYPLFRKLFMCPNPVPVKEALYKKGIINNYVRLPLVTMNETEKEDFYKVLNNY